jgi:hypothetical protein
MDLEELIQRAADENGLDPAQVRALIGIESSGNPNAVSPKGAMGMMQLMPGTARELGVTDPFDPEQNIMAGSRYFRDQLDEFGDPALAAAAYNAGPGAVRKYGGVPPYRETRDYVDKFRRRMGSVGMAPEAGMYGDEGMTGDPTADAMAMLPQVSRSAVDQNVIRSTMGVADKLINGQVTGSLTSPQDRMENSTGSLAAEMIPTWQTAQKLLNPVNLLQLPMRALKMVDYTLRQAAGAPTLTDAAEQALAYTNAGEFISRDPEATARDARQQELTTAKGLRGQILTPTQKLVHIFTTDPFEGERQAITARQAMQAGLTAQMDLDKAFKGRVEREQKTAEAPYEVAKKRAEAQKATAEAPFAARMAEAQVRNMEALPEYRQQSLFAQRLAARRSLLMQPDERGYGPEFRYKMNRDTADDVRRVEAEERARREREQEMADRAAARADDRAFAEQGRLQDDTRAALAAAFKAKTADDANLLLAGTLYEAKPNGNWLGRKFDIVPKESAAPAASAAATPTPTAAAPAMSGPTNYDAAMGKAREKARQALLRQGNATPSQRQIDDMATELLHQAGIR